MGQGLSIASAIIDPVSFGAGYASEAVNPGGLFSAASDVGLNMFGKAGVASAAGGDVGQALIKGAGTDIRRGSNIVGGFFTGGAGWAAEAAATASDFASHQNVGLIGADTANYIGLGTSAAAGAWNIGSSLASSAANAATEAGSAATSAASAAGEVGTGATANSLGAASMLSDSSYLNAFNGTNQSVFREGGLTFAQALEQGTAANYGSSVDAINNAGVYKGVGGVASGAKEAGAGGSSAWDTVNAWTPTALKVGSAGLTLYNSYLGAQSARAAADAEARSLRDKANAEAANAEMAEMKAGIEEMKMNAETAAAAEERMQLGKRRRAIVGKGKTAAAANGVMLETRAESSPAMFEQDAAAEMAYEQGKIDYNMRIKNSIHAANAALHRVEAGSHKMNSAGLLSQASYAKRLGNLKSTSSWVQGLIGAGTGLISAYYDSPIRR